ncbi:MAG: 2-oxoacid:acceptor oxidoreductase family protein [Xanthomonadales bacterium]|jgi:2-oxoacid:acceptor oxidoreductase gamma subunit (pyruvate/2-ketoisovalerate family)|nr:2-oxoacid:acceptor oxidoreductase family protein [Xanthomonadales bacterium]
MIEIRIHGRGGQGGVTLAKLLAAAEHREGKSVQAFGVYAAERSGAPVQAFLRVDDEPIHNPNQIYEPDHLVVLDPTLISPAILSGLKPGGFILMNCDKSPNYYAAEERAKKFRIATVDASSIARKHELGSASVPIVNTALAGAAAKLLGMSLESVINAFSDFGFAAGNIDAAREAYELVRVQRNEPEPGEQKKEPGPAVDVHSIIDGNSGAPPVIKTGQWANTQPAWENSTPPCNFICPAGNDVQGFLKALADEEVDRALGILLETTPLPSVCGRVCPGFCMMQCNRSEMEGPVNVRALERYAGDHGKAAVEKQAPRPQRVAIIGGGPAGLSGAYQLARLGYGVTIFEAGEELGGLMRTGIPSYRLPREALERDIERVLALGVDTVFNVRVDRERLAGLTHEYDAVLAATGLQTLTSVDLGVDLGSGASRVMQGIEFLEQVAEDGMDVSGEKVVVVGGGNTAIDAARSAFRLGAESVRIIYRRTRDEMPAIPEEVDDAIDEGIQIDFLTAPQQISRDAETRKLSCQRMELGEPDESGRRRPVALPGSDFEIPCDRVILAIGQRADLSLLPEDAELSRQQPVENGCDAPVYPAGDLLTNEGTVTAAIGCGRDMALLLHERFSGERLYHDKPAEETVVRADGIRMHHFSIQRPQAQGALPLDERRSFEEVHQGLEGIEEAKRCLSCGVCNACDRCVTYCPDGVLRREGNRIVFDYDYCKGCGICVSECSRAVIYMKAG